MLLARAVYPELTWLTIVIAVPLVAVLGGLIKQNGEALKGRSAAYGLNSLVTILLVVSIVGVVNYLASKYPQKLDLTKNKVHTLSEQTVKLVKGLQKPVKATLFAKFQEKEKYRPLLDDYKGLSTKFEVEYVDPDKEPTRAKAANVRKYGTLVLSYGTRDSQVEDLTEEKVTNALIKLTKDKTPTLCTITGHGEKNFSSSEADGYDSIRKLLLAQSDEVKDINLVQEAKIPDNCDALAIVGPLKAFFDPEIKLLRDYLKKGGRLVVAVDLNIKGGEYSPELMALLAEWHVKADAALIVDPLSKMFGVDAAMPILATYQKDNPITKDFGGQNNCFFPITRPLEIIAGAPAGVNVQWLAQTTPKSVGVTNLKEVATGKVQIDEARDIKGPMTVAIAVSGKDKDSGAAQARDTRIVVFGTSDFASNKFQRYGNNLDFFLNAAAWVLEDESMISIRAKEEGPGKVELTQKAGTFIFILTVILIPLLIFVGGIVSWVVRKRL
jgi:ABC-type uncharacterized transport system involved in gliding motility auxiliary subunit